MGSADRIIRAVLAAFFAVLYLTGAISGTLGIVLLILAGVFAVTGFIGFCPLYTLFDLNTFSSQERNKK